MNKILCTRKFFLPITHKLVKSLVIVSPFFGNFTSWILSDRLLGKAYSSGSQHLGSPEQPELSGFPGKASAGRVDCGKCCTEPTANCWPSGTRQKERLNPPFMGTEGRSCQNFKATFVAGHSFMEF